MINTKYRKIVLMYYPIGTSFRKFRFEICNRYGILKNHTHILSILNLIHRVRYYDIQDIKE